MEEAAAAAKAEAEAAAKAEAEAAAVASLSLQEPEPPPLPRGEILTVKLSEVEGAQVGGAVHILALGESVVGDARWLMPCPRSGGEQTLTLRDGFCGRRTVTRGALAGRTYEFWVERLEALNEMALHGGPLWVGRELKAVAGLVSQGARVVGRRPGQPSTPAALWAALAARCGSTTRVNNANAWCGLLHPSVQGLLDAAAAPPQPTRQRSLAELAGEAAAIGSRAGGLRELRADGSQLRLIGSLASEAFLAAMKAISPTEPEFVFEQLLKRKEFQLTWLPEELRSGLSKVCCCSTRLLPPPSPPSPPPPSLPPP